MIFHQYRLMMKNYLNSHLSTLMYGTLQIILDEDSFFGKDNKFYTNEIENKELFQLIQNLKHMELLKNS